MCLRLDLVVTTARRPSCTCILATVSPQWYGKSRTVHIDTLPRRVTPYLDHIATAAFNRLTLFPLIKPNIYTIMSHLGTGNTITPKLNVHDERHRHDRSVGTICSIHSFRSPSFTPPFPIITVHKVISIYTIPIQRLGGRSHPQSIISAINWPWVVSISWYKTLDNKQGYGVYDNADNPFSVFTI